MKRIACIAISLALAAGLCACGGAGDFSLGSPSEPPELELKVYTQSIDPAKAVHAEYYEIVGWVPWGRFSELNDRLRTLYLWEFISGNVYSEGVKLPPMVDPESSYESKAGYTIVGDYISATRVLKEYKPDLDYPIETFKAETWNMYGKVWIFRPEDLEYDKGYAAWDAIDRAMENGKCRLTYPDRDIPGAVDVLRESLAEDYMQRDRFFLAETGLGFYLNERRHEDGDYWLFEIAYEDLEGMRSALGGQ